MNLEAQLESLLFYFSEPKSVGEIAGMLKISHDEVRTLADSLSARLLSRGVRLMQNNDELALVTAGEAAELLERIVKEEREKDLGKAALETLSIILYHGPLTRSAIDHIRGVNSTFIVRNLLIRGLVEKVPNPDDQRSFLYKPTIDLLRFLGVTNATELPDYEKVRQELEAFIVGTNTPPEENPEPIIQAEDSPQPGSI